MDPKELMAIFNDPTRFGTLATADAKGKVDNAVFSAIQMLNESTVVLALGDNRSYANLKDNPQAAYVFFFPDPDPFAWRGARVYLRMRHVQEEGPIFEQMVAVVRRMAGGRAADNLKAVVTFDIEEIRPLIAGSN